jgi:hypothetical protein
MRSWTDILIGAVGLAVLDAVLSSTSGASNVGGFLAGLGNAVNRFVSPAVPAFTVSSSGSSGQAPAGGETTQSGAAVEAGNTVPALSPSEGTALGGGQPIFT